MQKLTNKEEEIMHILWKLKKAFVKAGGNLSITKDTEICAPCLKPYAAPKRADQIKK